MGQSERAARSFNRHGVPGLALVCVQYRLAPERHQVVHGHQTGDHDRHQQRLSTAASESLEGDHTP